MLGNQPSRSTQKVNDYDLVIVGAGASGLFASGAALSFGLKTLLVDKGNNGNYIGGDCTNCACVPSKALRSISRQLSTQSSSIGTTTICKTELIAQARAHTFNTVRAVRKRESKENFANVTNLSLELVDSSRFVSENEMDLVPQRGSNKTIQRIRAKKFLIATGASPIVPANLKCDAEKTGIPIFTYRDILSPETNNSLWEELRRDAASPASILVVGGGPTALELSQALTRLKVNITLVAPTLLAAEDVSLQQAACKILRGAGVSLILGKRVVSVNRNKDVMLNDGTRVKTDVLVVCVGRNPAIASLQLDAASVAWDESSGILVNPSSLRSKTNARVFACGDCCSAVLGKDRKAAHAAWTGYHAIRNIALPRIL